MNTKKILSAWLSTVIIGSLLLALILSSFSEGIFFLMSILISAVLSLPTLITLLIVNTRNAHQEENKRTKAVNLAHLTMFLITLLIGGMIIRLMGVEALVLFTGATILYAVVATIVWFLILKIA